MVQGVGFRPHVHRVAMQHGVTGWVRNESGEVSIFAEGSERRLRSFVAALGREWPVMARVDRVEIEAVSPEGLSAFRIVESETTGAAPLPVSPDVAMCDRCQSELFDPSDRRYRYPFITCTDCGPRYTVIEEMPYDRERTSMAVFRQCEACRAEYRDPGDRRYHSETNSCPECGPRVWLEVGKGRHEGVRALEEAARLLASGRIVALRGLGGFHLAASAADENAVLRLRRRKGRDAKPLAVMVATLADAAKLVALDEESERLLTSPARPIVLLPRLPGAPLAPSVAPGLTETGVMLAYTPLHRLLLEESSGALVMTSGNRSDEPIATGVNEARSRLRGIADAFLQHDREIVSRYDDSVIRPGPEGPVFLRRSRGYAPLPLRLPMKLPTPLLAVGAHLKNTFTLARGETAHVSQHIGDLETLETLGHFHESLGRFRSLFRVDPRLVVHDLHPGYLSTRVAEELAAEMEIEHCWSVQHHHAHVAAVAAEHGWTAPLVGLAFDGVGYGDDGRIWGGETLVADLSGYRRVGRLRYAPMPGGDLAARTPWRAALGYGSLAGLDTSWVREVLADVDGDDGQAATWQIETKTNAPLTSSMGRLFDAAAAILGVRRVARYEGQAAMELEAAAGPGSGTSDLPFPLLADGEGGWIMDPVPLLAALAEGRRSGRPTAELAGAFHDTVAETATELAARVAEAESLSVVALSGGVFQNSRLRTAVRELLEERGLMVLVPRLLSPNDGAISYGQAAVAAAWLTRNREEV